MTHIDFSQFTPATTSAEMQEQCLVEENERLSEAERIQRERVREQFPELFGEVHAL